MSTPVKCAMLEFFRNPSTPTSVKPDLTFSLKIQKRKVKSKSPYATTMENSFTQRTNEGNRKDPSSEDSKLLQHHIARFHKEFFEIGTLGSFYHCFHRLDGCKYTLEKLPAAGSLNEVRVHAALDKHQNIVTYYSAWAEDGHVMIQREFCNGGSLADVIRANRNDGLNFSHDELKSALFQMANGLVHIHSKRMVHTDMKPSNIFVCTHPHDASGPATYKIGGFKSALPWTGHEDIDKSDVFDLGRIIWEMAAGSLDVQMNELLSRMMHPQVEERPSSQMLILDPLFDDHAGKSCDQLDKELQAERMQNRRLSNLLQKLQHRMQRLN